MASEQKITPCLWFNFNAEEAVNYYLDLFAGSKILQVSYYGDAFPEFKGRVLTIRFELAGRPFLALNGGAQFPFTEAISLSVDCADQTEVDRLWEQLTKDGSPGRCGWLKDKYGLSWQIVPRQLVSMITDPDPVKATRVMTAMMTMTKIDLARLQQAYDAE